MAKTREGESMERIVALVAKVLKAKGFRKRRHSFNRVTSDSLAQVINFQMGLKPIGEHYEIPGLRESRFGLFTVNLGVSVPELFRQVFKQEFPAFINDYECNIRSRLPRLNNEPNDRWWPLCSDDEGVAGEVLDLLNNVGTPFLERFSSRVVIIREWPLFAVERSLSARPNLDVALILDAMGRKDEAVAAFKKHISLNRNPAHEKYCAELARLRGWAV